MMNMKKRKQIEKNDQNKSLKQANKVVETGSYRGIAFAVGWEATKGVKKASMFASCRPCPGASIRQTAARLLWLPASPFRHLP